MIGEKNNIYENLRAAAKKLYEINEHKIPRESEIRKAALDGRLSYFTGNDGHHYAAYHKNKIKIPTMICLLYTGEIIDDYNQIADIYRQK